MVQDGTGRYRMVQNGPGVKVIPSAAAHLGNVSLCPDSSETVNQAPCLETPTRRQDRRAFKHHQLRRPTTGESMNSFWSGIFKSSTLRGAEASCDMANSYACSMVSVRRVKATNERHGLWQAGLQRIEDHSDAN